MQGDASLPLVSIIVPVYNSEPFLDELLDSVAGQTYDALDVILVDDGSSDSSFRMCEIWKEKDGRFRVFRQPNLGAGVARNAGVSLARGEFVICIDSDDLIAPDMIEKMVYPCLTDPDIQLVLCGLDEYIDATREYRKASWAVNVQTIPVRVPFSPSSVPFLFEQVVGYPWNKLVRKSLVHEWGLRWQEIPMHEDMAFAQTALALAKKSYFIDEPLYHHRIRGDGAALSSDANQDARYECLFAALEEIANNLKRAGCWEVYETSFANYALRQCRWKYYRVSSQARSSVLSSLKNEWLDRLGLTGYKEEMYAVRAHYLFMRAVLESETPQEVEDVLESMRESASSRREVCDAAVRRNGKLGVPQPLISLLRSRLRAPFDAIRGLKG